MKSLTFDEAKKVLLDEPLGEPDKALLEAFRILRATVHEVGLLRSEADYLRGYVETLKDRVNELERPAAGPATRRQSRT